MVSKRLRQQKRDAARTDIPQNWAVSKNVMQHGQIYPKTEPSAKCDAAWIDICQKQAVSNKVTQHGQIYPKTGQSAKK